MRPHAGVDERETETLGLDAQCLSMHEPASNQWIRQNQPAPHSSPVTMNKAPRIPEEGMQPSPHTRRSQPGQTYPGVIKSGWSCSCESP